MNERRELPVVGSSANRLNPTAGRDASVEPTVVMPPGESLRDPAYHDICGFFSSYPDAQAWQPQVGDWVWWPGGSALCLIIDTEITGPGSGDDKTEGPRRPRVCIMSKRPAEATWVSGDDCVWLPTLDQLVTLLHANFGSTGFFSSVFTGRTFWYLGELAGMEVENMVPLAEGRSPEEAAIKALLMRYQR